VNTMSVCVWISGVGSPDLVFFFFFFSEQKVSSLFCSGTAANELRKLHPSALQA